MEPPKTLGDLLAEGEARLASCGIERPRLEAEVLMAHALGVDRGRLALLLAGGHGAPPGGGVIDVPAAVTFRRTVKRRGLREPLAYITGHREFWSLDFEVTPAVLIPRPETEILVQEAVSTLPHGPALIVEVGAGSGAVAVALAVERPAAFVVGIDSSAQAIAVARRNIARHGVGARVRLVRGDLLSPLHRRDACDTGHRMVVSNPPYVGTGERETLMPEVRDWEPAEALYAGASGMEVIERLVPQAAEFLAPNGWLLLESAASRAGDVVRLLESSGLWQEVSVRDDYSGLPRVIRARARHSSRPAPWAPAVEHGADQRR